MPDLRAAPPFELGVIASGVLAFICSFLPWYGATGSGSVAGFRIGTASYTLTAWHSYSTVGLLLVLAGTVLMAAVSFGRAALPATAVGWRWIAAAMCSLGALLYLIRLLTLHHDTTSFGGYKVSVGVRWGGWLLLIVVLVNAALAVLAAMRSDEPTPWQSTSRAAPPVPPPAA